MGKPISFEVWDGPVFYTGGGQLGCNDAIVVIYSGYGTSGSGSFNVTGQPPIRCDSYAMVWSNVNDSDAWTNASFVSVNLSWGPR